MHALHAPGAEMLKPGHLGVQVIGVDIQMHAGSSLAQALGERRRCSLRTGQACGRGARRCLPRRADGHPGGWPPHRAVLPQTSQAADHFGFSVLSKGKLRGFARAWNERIEPDKPRVPNPEVLAVRVASLAEKEELLAADPEKSFTEPHYNGFPAVLVRLPAIGAAELAERSPTRGAASHPAPWPPSLAALRSRARRGVMSGR